jgi:hypothetical protein
LSQQKCRATWPRFGGLHNYPLALSLKKSFARSIIHIMNDS